MRDALTSFQREAVARLVTEAERCAQTGALPFERELALRAVANLAASAFDMAPVMEREQESVA